MKRILFILPIVALFTFVFQSCNKESNEPNLLQTQVEFAFSTSQLKSDSLQGLTNVVVTIEDVHGNVVKNSEKIEIYNMNGHFISEPISLVVGDYKLSRFLVLNATNKIVYASPVEGSIKANLVKKTLPLMFSAQKDSVTKLSPEVLSTAGSRPEDFGYATFSFEIAETFDFLIGAFVYDSLKQNFELTNASIAIYSDTNLVYSGRLTADSSINTENYDELGVTNTITLPETFNNYTLEISKTGYMTHVESFNKEELRLHYRNEDKGPLVVILEGACQLPLYSASFAASPSLWPGSNVTIENFSITDADSYEFDFGDSTIISQTSFVSNFSYSYSTYGDYIIKLTVTKDGCISTYQEEIRIIGDTCQLPPNSASFSVSPAVQMWPDNIVQIENLSINDADSYMFSFGDGTTITQTSFTPNFTHAYNAYGSYIIKLLVTKDGCTRISQREVSIEYPQPVISTTSVSGITQTTAIGGGSISSDNGTVITGRGLCFSTSTNPTIANNFTVAGINGTNLVY